MKFRIPKDTIAKHRTKTAAKQQVSKKVDLSEKLKKPIAFYCRPDLLRRFEKEHIAFYCRIRNNDDQGRAILESIGKKIVETIKSNSDTMEFAGIYIDFGGSNDEHRPELERLVADCEAGKIDLVITKNMAQIYRSPSKVLSLILKLRKSNSNFRICFEDFGPDTGHIDFYKIIEAIVESEKNNTFECHISHRYLKPISKKKINVYYKMFHR